MNVVSVLWYDRIMVIKLISDGGTYLGTYDIKIDEKDRSAIRKLRKMCSDNGCWYEPVTAPTKVKSLGDFEEMLTYGR